MKTVCQVVLENGEWMVQSVHQACQEETDLMVSKVLLERTDVLEFLDIRDRLETRRQDLEVLKIEDFSSPGIRSQK